jgi:hypothetical protein
MNFGEALEKCKAGARIQRSGWNGKNQYVFLISDYMFKREEVPALIDDPRDEISFWGCFCIMTTNGKVQMGWLATQSDMQANDWQVVTQDAPGKTPASTDKPDRNSIEIDLTLPKADIGGLHFNKQKVHAVFERHDDDWFYSRDIMFLSARNAEDDNSRDILTEYLNDDRIKKQLGDLFNLPPVAVAVTLPRENQGIKQYHGVECWYWLASPYSSYAAYFCSVNHLGNADNGLANTVIGCSPAFRVAERRR